MRICDLNSGLGRIACGSALGWKICKPSVTNSASYWISNLPYLLYPIWLIPVLLFRRSLFTSKGQREPAIQ